MYAKEQATRRYGLETDVLEIMIPMLRSRVKCALAEFYLELACMLQDCRDSLCTLLRDETLPMQQALDCCYHVARSNVRRRLALPEQ